MKRMAIFDLDGVMNSISDVRAHLVPENTDRADHWAEWHKAHVKEKVNPAMVAVVRGLGLSGWGIVIVSNRIDTFNYTTFSQLRDSGLSDVAYLLVTRRGEDNTPPVKYKVNTIRDLVVAQTMTSPEIEYVVFDDDPDVVEQLNNLVIAGLTAIFVPTYKG